MACAGKAVQPAATLVGVAALAPDGHTAQIGPVGGAGIGAQGKHQRPPLSPVGFHPAASETLVHRIVGYFMGHGITQMQGHIRGKHPGIEAQPPARCLIAVHARGATGKIKAYLNGGQLHLEDVTGPLDIRLDPGANRCVIFPGQRVVSNQSALPGSSTSRSSRLRNLPLALRGSGSARNHR